MHKVFAFGLIFMYLSDKVSLHVSSGNSFGLSGKCVLRLRVTSVLVLTFFLTISTILNNQTNGLSCSAAEHIILNNIHTFQLCS